MKTLIAYITKGGATAAYARVIGQVLAARGHEVDIVDLKKQRKPALAGYETVVLGSGVRIGMVYRVGKRFLRRDDLKDKQLAIFLASGIAIEDAHKAKQKFLDPLIERYGLHPLMCDALPGRTPGAAGKAPDTTDPARAREWAETLAERLGSSSD
jgi:menaquinone-dependent protoporphyrinogen IX oxidase